MALDLQAVQEIDTDLPEYMEWRQALVSGKPSVAVKSYDGGYELYCGFYQGKKDGVPVPVAIVEENDMIYTFAGYDNVPPSAVYPHCLENPISREEFFEMFIPEEDKTI